MMVPGDVRTKYDYIDELNEDEANARAGELDAQYVLSRRDPERTSGNPGELKAELDRVNARRAQLVAEREGEARMVQGVEVSPADQDPFNPRTQVKGTSGNRIMAQAEQDARRDILRDALKDDPEFRDKVIADLEADREATRVAGEAKAASQTPVDTTGGTVTGAGQRYAHLDVPGLWNEIENERDYTKADVREHSGKASPTRADLVAFLEHDDEDNAPE